MNTVTEKPVELTRKPQTAAPYNLALGYLRAFITVLVVVHHAVLAYCTFAPPPAATLTAQPWWMAFPVVDRQRWEGFSLVVGFNDVFFMSLMFFLSGLFTWGSLERKGTAQYLHDRILRLGFPFLAASALIAPLAYYPAYLQSTSHTPGFWRQWLSLGVWPSGPAWFLWVLFVFGAMAAVRFHLLRGVIERAGRWLSDLSLRPARFFVLLSVISAAAYAPLALAFDPIRWAAFGPFTFQTSRILHYLVYFFIAVALGAAGTSRGLLAPDGKLARRWPLWLGAAFVAFVLISGITVAALANPAKSQAFATAGAFAFALSCAASCLAFLAFFLRFATRPIAILDSLRNNAYGIYILHYPCVSWLQYALLGSTLPGLAKGAMVSVEALILSWCATALLRRLPAIARVL